jgi:hypothetical protein
MDLMTISALVFCLLGALLLLGGLAALRRRRLFRTSLHTVLAVASLSVGALLITVQVSLQGYRALTREEVAAIIRTEPLAPSRFRVEMQLINGNIKTYEIAGDEVYVDAHILKWKSWANLLGLHTAYELDRLGGRYTSIEDERIKPRTMFSLAPARPLDVFALRQRYAALSPLVDAEYGSAVFLPVHDRMTLEVRVSTSGLLLRPIESAFLLQR